MNNITKVLAQITDLLLTYNTALPIVTGAVTSIAAIVRGITGEGPTLAESIAVVKQRVAANKSFGEAEIARLDALL